MSLFVSFPNLYLNIKDEFVSGLKNETLQKDLLAKASQLNTIKDILKHVEAFETAVRDQPQLHTSAEAQAARILTYRRNKQQSKRFPLSTSKEVCAGCDSTNHGVVGAHPRHSHSSAWDKLCQTCKKPNHFALVCREPSDINAIIDSPQLETGSLIGQVEHDSTNDIFTSSNALQEIEANVFTKLPNASAVTISIIPESGTNICLAAPKHLHQMGVHPSQLHTCNKTVKAVGGSTLICKGWLPVRFEIEGHATKQPVYICEKPDRLYFIKQECIQVNILSRDYPGPMHLLKAHAHSHVQYLNKDNLPPASPTTPPPPAPPAKPAKLPYPPTTENIPKLEQ